MTRLLRASALALATAVTAGALAAMTPAASAAEPDGGAGTTTTVAGGPFAGLEVTVSQTRNLINQVVTVSWKNATPTVPEVGRFGIHYLSLMQCWGDEAAGPQREQCQYGGQFGVDQRGGSFVSSRQVSYGSQLVDPKENYQTQPGSNQQAYVPFESVTGKVGTGGVSEFFDQNTTNEVPFGRTRTNGTGTERFEIQTSREAPGLGCGTRTDAGAVRNCWFVAVPRSDREVDGTTRSGTGQATELESSPLSASNWEHRVVIPLQFESLGNTCPQASERRTIGQELVTELITRWQPALCANGGATYGFSQVTDAFARNKVASPDPGLAFTSKPVDPAAVDPTRPLVYAPVAAQGLAVSFLVERRPLFAAPREEQLKAGTPVTDVKLTARLLAKLLTQSYRNATPEDNPTVKDNPQLLTTDPEFLALNPEFRQLSYSQLSDVVVAVGQSDANELVWSYIDGDAEARAWLDGGDDGHGMKVNPAFKGLELPVPELPKNDGFCRKYDDGKADLCALERRPYAADLNEAGRFTARGDNLSRQTWDPNANPPAWRRSGAQPTGQRGVMTITDTATAHRYGLGSASLRNRAGRFVAPDEAGLTAGLATFKAGATPAVLEPDPGAVAEAAYPLTTLSYAVTAPAALDAAAGRDYAALLDYAAGPGQQPGITPGTLPEGYVPLPDAMRAQTAAAAKTVRETAGVPVVVPAGPAPGEAGAPGALAAGTPAAGAGSATTGFGASSDGSAGGSFGLPSGAGASGSGLSTPGAAPSPLEIAEAEAEAATLAVSSPGTTPGGPLGLSRYWLPALLLLGVVAALLGPALTRRGPSPLPRPVLTSP